MESVTDEILLLICGFLNTEDLISISQVNKRFHNISHDPTLNRRIEIHNNLHVSSTILHRRCNQYANHLHTLIFKDCFWIPSYQIVAALQRCTKLKILFLTGCKLSMAGLVKISTSNPNLQKLGWSIPSTNISTELRKNEKLTPLFHDIQSVFKKLSSLILRFETLASFEQFLPLFDSKEIFVEEFGLEYLSDRSSSYFTIGNTYSVHVKCREKFQLCLSHAINANRFLHFNLLVMDFVIQTIVKVSHTKQLTVLLAPGNINSPCWKYITTVLDSILFKRIDLSYCLLCKEQMTWLSKLTKLTHLNLSAVGSFKGNLMRVIANNCEDLVALNLTDCDDWIDKELHGLDAVATSCSKLKELNLSCLHIHAGQYELNKLCSLIGKMKNLTSLSIPACNLINNINLVDTKVKSANASRYKPQTASKLVLFDESSSSSVETGDDSLSRKLRSSQEELDISFGLSGLDSICRDCVKLRELEIIDTGFHSAFSKLSNQDQFYCPQTSHLKDKNFLPICQLTNLTKLTLAGLSGVSSFSSLSKITASCEQLEVLSIAHCGLSGHSGALSSLKSALTNCKKLKKFRLDQPHYILRENILSALYNCKRLEILCIISKNGKVPKNADIYISLFENCPRLVAFFLFSGSLVSEAKKLQSTLVKKYQRTRPSLCVTVLPYFNALTEEGLRQVPYVYLRDVIRFESRVATCKHDS